MVNSKQYGIVRNPNADLAVIPEFKNLGFNENINYWCDINGTNFRVLSTDKLTGITTVENTHDLSTVAGIGTYSGFNSKICKVVFTNADWFVIASIAFFDAAGNEAIFIMSKNLTDGGAWQDARPIFIATGSGYKLWVIDAYVLDQSDANTNLLYYVEGAPNRMISGQYQPATGTAASLHLLTFTALADGSFYSGVMDTHYYFEIVDGAGDTNLYYVRNTDGQFVFVEFQNELDDPATWNLAQQLYWRQNGNEYRIDADHFYFRDIDSDWSAYTADEIATLGVIFDYNENNVQIIKKTVWDKWILKFRDGGALAKFQHLTTKNFKKLMHQQDEAIPGVVQWGTKRTPETGAWSINETLGTTFSIVASIGGHIDVLQLDDQSAVNAVSATLVFDANHLDGIIELWIAKSTLVSADLSFRFLEGATRVISLYFSDDNLEGHESDHVLVVIDGDFFTDENTFVHLKLVLDDTANTYDIYRNGVLIAAAFEFYDNSTDGIDRFFLGTRGNHTGYQYWIDSIGFSWDTYQLHDNAIPKAVVGWKDWFGSGDGFLYELLDSDFQIDTTGIITTMLYSAPEAQIITQIKPTIDQALEIFDRHWNKIYQGDVKQYRSDQTSYNYAMKSGIKDDLRAKAVVAFETKTAHFILKYVIDNFCSTLWYKDGIDDTPVDTHSPKWKKNVLHVFKWADAREGMSLSIRSSGEVYWNTYGNGFEGRDYKSFNNTEFWVYQKYRDYKYLQALTDEKVVNTLITGIVDWGTTLNPDLSGLTVVEGDGCTVQILDRLDGHVNLLEMSDQSAGANLCRITKVIDSTADSVEFYLSTTDITMSTYFFLNSSSVFIIRLGASLLSYFQFGVAFQTILVPVNGETYHIRVSWDTATDLASIWVNGTLAVADLPFGVVQTSITALIWETDDGHSNYKSYVDAIGFTGDGYTVGENRQLWGFINTSGQDCSVQIIESLDGHSNVMMLNDQSNANRCTITKKFTGQISGSVEGFIATNHTIAQYVRVNIYSGGTRAVIFELEFANIYFYGNAGQEDIGDYIVNKFVHFRIDFDCVADTQSIWINGIQVVTNREFFSNGTFTTLDKIDFTTETGNNGYISYVDGLGFSWEEYVAGANQEVIISESDFATTPVIDVRTLKFSKIVVRGGYNSLGQKLSKILFGEPGFGTWADTFAELITQADVDAMAAQIAADKNIEISGIPATFFKKGMMIVGTRALITNLHLGIVAEEWYVFSTTYNIISGELGVSLMDSFLQGEDRSDDSQRKPDANETKIENLEQDVGQVQERVTYTPRDNNNAFLTDADLDANTNWNTYDFSSVIGSGAKWVQIHAEGKDNVINSTVGIRPCGFTSEDPWTMVHSIIANNESHDTRELLTDENGCLEIRTNPAPASWTEIKIYVISSRDA